MANSLKDIGKLLDEVQKDIQEEEQEAIKSFLWKEFKREILKEAVKGLPEWYKEKLLKRSFDDKEI